MLAAASSRMAIKSTDDVDGIVDFFRRNEETVEVDAIEAFRIFPDSGVTALFDVGQDSFDSLADVFTFCLVRLVMRRMSRKVNPSLGTSIHSTLTPLSYAFMLCSRMTSMSCWISLYFILKETGLQIMRALKSMKYFRTSRPLAFKVLPVSTISTMTSDKPTIGASSTGR